jgi:hypothetical protein
MTIRLLPFLLVLLGVALPGAAQTPDPPRFLLESIVVEGVQRDAVREIVAAESLLQLGREYSEQELREAVYRVKRLPFVVDAEFSLRKGGERGSYQLVITVEETRLIFYAADVGGAYSAYDPPVPTGQDRVEWGATATLGGRWFVGSQGLVFASFQGYDGLGLQSGQVGYTRYNLFGRGGFASVALYTNLDEDLEDSYQSSLSAGIPIVGNHSLRADLSWGHFKDDSLGTTFQLESKSLGLAWIYDTTDDPLFPTSGTRVVTNVQYFEDEHTFEDPFARFEDRFESYGAGLGGSRYWALTHRQSIFVDLGGSWGHSTAGGRSGIDSWTVATGLGHSMDLWGFEKTERIGDLRWQNFLTVSSSDSDSPFGPGRYTEGRLTTSLVFRNTWGVIRGSFTYLDILENGR